MYLRESNNINFRQPDTYFQELYITTDLFLILPLKQNSFMENVRRVFCKHFLGFRP